MHSELDTCWGAGQEKGCRQEATVGRARSLAEQHMTSVGNALNMPPGKPFLPHPRVEVSAVLLT